MPACLPAGRVTTGHGLALRGTPSGAPRRCRERVMSLWLGGCLDPRGPARWQIKPSCGGFGGGGGPGAPAEAAGPAGAGLSRLLRLPRPPCLPRRQAGDRAHRGRGRAQLGIGGVVRAVATVARRRRAGELVVVVPGHDPWHVQGLAGRPTHKHVHQGARRRKGQARGRQPGRGSLPRVFLHSSQRAGAACRRPDLDQPRACAVRGGRSSVHRVGGREGEGLERE